MAHEEQPPFIVPAAIDDANLTVYQFRALAHVWRRAGSHGLYYGSGTKSAATCGMSLRQWRRAIADLVSKGWLTVTEQAAGFRSVYRCTPVTSAPQSPVTGRHRTGAPQALQPEHNRHTYKKGSPRRSPLKESPPAPAAQGVLLDGVREDDNGNGASKATATANDTKTVLEVEVLAPGEWPSNWTDRIVRAWGDPIDHGKVGKILKPLKGRCPLDDIEAGLARYVAAGNRRYGLVKFVETLTEWLGGGSPLNGGRLSPAQATAVALEQSFRVGR